MNPEGRELDKKHLGKSNWVVVKSAIDARANMTVGYGTGKRADFSQAEIDLVTERLSDIIAEVGSDLF